ncbi:MAG: nucleoside permease [Calditrichae bacterium]|nr:nucleoside permease [Calditrichota bacterium]MCB9058560.1 nucleoside permease [Calditrichia bacterium]
MKPKIYTQLSVMMFLQFFIWGAWFVTLGTYLNALNFSGSDVGYTYLMNNIAAIISPFFVGMIADRFFSSQKVMAVLHLLGGVVIYYVSDATTGSYLIFGLLIYNILYMPTIALSNAVSFNQMENPDAQFPYVRVWGTIGWIVAGLIISFVLANYVNQVEATAVPMKMAAAGSIILGIYAFFLPDTPPKNIGKDITMGDIVGIKALKLLKDKNFTIFVISSLFICIPLAFYYNFTNMFLNELGMTGTAAKQSMGQMSEVIFMFLMPWFFVRLGVKKMLMVGMLSWVLRYILFAHGDLGGMVWMLYLGILLHGLCYDFFFVTGMIYVDKKAGVEIRAQAQGFISLVTYGIGIGLGSVISGQIVDYFTSNGIKDWTTIWWIPALFAGIVAVFFVTTFKNDHVSKAKVS